MRNTTDQHEDQQDSGQSLTIAYSFDNRINGYTLGLGSALSPATFGSVNIPATTKTQEPDDKAHFFRVR